MVTDIEELEKDLDKHADKNKAEILMRFFKTGKGQYGEGDIFLGIQVPQLRKIAKKYFTLDYDTALELLKSPIHEKRLLSLFILTNKFEKGDYDIKKAIFDLYINNTVYINNWDLVDLSADKIVGEFLYGRNTDILLKLAESGSLWERRIAIIATFNFIKKQHYQMTLKISEMLLQDKHDLIHKAVGWMLREVGKRISADILLEFLNRHYKRMPRTMLRYSIEKLPEDLRLSYLYGKV